MNCPLMKGGPGVCHWCAGELTGRRRKWCSDECRWAWWSHHDWGSARKATLERDSWTCVRCGFVGWWDAPRSLTGMQSDDRDELRPWGTSLEDWAVALGLVEPDLREYVRWDPGRNRRVDEATSQLPESIHRLVKSEKPTLWSDRARLRHGPSSHQLEVNHIEPRRGRGYTTGCHNHPENLETLCRPCHVEETTRQRRGLPSWREDPRPLSEIELDGTLLELMEVSQ